MKKKVFIVGTPFASSFRQLFKRDGWEVVTTPEEADFLQFTGGADIGPRWYGQLKHPRTYDSPARDNAEVEVFGTFEGRKNMLGVCRGAQLFCAMSGGSLYQDVDNHTSQHKVVDVKTEREIVVSSVHHQMMRPPANAEVLAICNVATRKEYVNTTGGIVTHDNIKMGDTYSGNADVEAVFFPTTMSLGFQPHPEFGPKSCADYYFELIERCFL